MPYFRETWKPQNVRCSSPSALSGILDRSGMGDLGKLPIELLIEVFKHVPFRQRLKATIFVSKSLQGLIYEKSLWKKVEIDRALVGQTLAYMIQPSLSAEPLIPKGSVAGLSVDMAYCTTGDVIGITKRLQSQQHAFTSLSMIGSWPLLMANIFSFSKQINRNYINFTRLTDLSIIGNYESTCNLQPEEVGGFLALVPNLLHFRMERKDNRYGVELKVDPNMLRHISGPYPGTGLALDAPQGRRLKTLIAPFWVLSLSAIVIIGDCFPELETVEFGMTVSCKDTTDRPVSPLPELKSATLTYHTHCKYAIAGVSEEKISKFFICFIANASKLRTLSFADESSSKNKPVDLFKWAKNLQQEGMRKIESRDLQKVDLKGWAAITPDCANQTKKFWHCPSLVDAPWLWVDIQRRERQRRRRNARKLRKRD